jgi:hypothetical protein
MTKDELIAYWMNKHSMQADEINRLQSVIEDLTHHGNGEVIRNWSKAYNRAMDQLEATEEKLRQERVKVFKLRELCEDERIVVEDRDFDDFGKRLDAI